MLGSPRDFKGRNCRMGGVTTVEQQSSSPLVWSKGELQSRPAASPKALDSGNRRLLYCCFRYKASACHKISDSSSYDESPPPVVASSFSSPLVRSSRSTVEIHEVDSLSSKAAEEVVLDDSTTKSISRVYEQSVNCPRSNAPRSNRRNPEDLGRRRRFADATATALR